MSRLRTALRDAAQRWPFAARVLASAAARLCSERALARLARSRWEAIPDFAEEGLLRSGLMDFERPYAHLPSGSRVAVVGCGGGREMLALRPLGYRLDGVDVSPACVEKARAELGAGAGVYLADAADFIFPGEPYDAFIFSWFTYGYIPGAGRRVRALRNARARLKPGGALFISVNPALREDMALAPASGDVLSRDLIYEHRFTREGLAREAREAGFELAEWSCDKDGTPPACLAVLRLKVL